MGWDYATFVRTILRAGRPIKELRAMRPNKEFDAVEAVDFHVHNPWEENK
jgi:hypothetical protein